MEKRTRWERFDDWVWLDGKQKEVMQQVLLLPPENETAEQIQNRYRLLSMILEKLPNFQVFVRLCLFILMAVLLLRDLDVQEDQTVWLTLPYILLLLHMFNLGLGAYMGFKLKNTEVLFRNNKHYLINSSADLEMFSNNEDSDSLFDLSGESDYVIPGQSLPKYSPCTLWKFKVLSTEITLLFISVDLAFYGLYMAVSPFFP